MNNYKINTYGCQMNVHESEKIARMLRDCGYQEYDENDYDILVFNTCCIRDNAEKKVLGHIGQIKKVKEQNPRLIVAVVGCMTQQEGAAKALIAKFPFVDIVLGTNNIHKLPEKIREIKAHTVKRAIEINPSESPEIVEFDGAYRTSGTNAWVNIMYGCNNFCTYCIVPYVRGRERSRDPEAIVAEVKKLLADGYKEITLLGQNVNSYGNDFDNDIDFAYLLCRIAEIEGDYRIRFMTSHPKDLTEKVVDMIAANKNICNYIHLPLQAGSNKILGDMNRRYTRERYLEIVDMIRAKIPDCGITTDLMVGFPGENEEDFRDTLDMVERCGFSAAFTYIYSPRKGTKAALMEQIPYKIKSERIQRLIKAQNAVTKRISRTYEGKVYRVLVEDVKGAGNLCGRTDCGRLVTFKGEESLIGKFVSVEISASQSASLYGRIVEID